MDIDQPQQSNQTLQFTSLSLFDEDPLSPDFSILEPEQQIEHHPLHLYQQEDQLSQTHYKIQMEPQHNKLKVKYQLIITSYRLIFFQIRQSQQKITLQVNPQSAPISLPYGFIEEVDLFKREIAIRLKTGLIFRIRPYTQLNNIYQTIIHGFAYLPFFTKQIAEAEQSISYDCLAELQRMRIPWDRFITIPNINGNLSPTYPKYFILTKGINENLMEECIKARNLGRIPVLTYFCSEFKSGLWRAARSKINQESNKYNRAFLKEISRSLIIVDLRDDDISKREKQAKMQTEYRKFKSLSVLNDLLKKIIVLYAKNEALFKVIGDWFEEISSIIETAYFVVKNLELGKEILLQESNGFDRVSQVSALVQLIIDPFFRTVHGFSLLIQKQFVSFGHPFIRRLGFEREKIGESSPIFIQFLQCVNQLLISHPLCFQFSGYYLAKIAYEAYSTKYNNFFFNTQKDKLNSKLVSKTPSIDRMPMRKQYYNYQWIQKYAVKALNKIRKPPSIKQFLVWRQYYDLVTKMTCQFENQINVKQRRSSLYKLLHRRDSKQN